MPWCKGSKLSHVAPMLWRYATVKVGARLDSERRYVAGKPGRAPAASEAVRRYLGFYGPGTPGEFAEWAGLAKPHAKRLWAEVEDDLVEESIGKRAGWILGADSEALKKPPKARGVRLIPPATRTCRSRTARCWRPTPACASASSGPSRAPASCSTTGAWSASGR